MPPTNGETFVTWKAAAISLTSCMVASVGAGALGVVFLWDRIDTCNAKIETRVSREDFAVHVAQQNRWQDKIEQRLDTLAARPVGFSLDGQRQFQLVLVEIPDTDADRHELRVREAMQMLAQENE